MATDSFDIDGFVTQRKELEALMMSNPAMERRVQGLIRKVLMAARREVAEAAKASMKSDPRQAYKAVKTAVYRRVLGGSVSILNKRKATQVGNYEPPRRPSARGGNRRERSPRTQQVMSYQGADRAFILRFLNEGTDDRAINFYYDRGREYVRRGSRGGNVSKYGNTVNTGYRGKITPRNWFSNSSHTAMQKAADQLATLIDEMITKEFK